MKLHPKHHLHLIAHLSMAIFGIAMSIVWMMINMPSTSAQLAIDLTITNTPADPVVELGQETSFQIFYKNASDPYVATSWVVVSVQFPAGFTNISSDPMWNQQDGNIYSYNVSDMFGEYLIIFDAIGPTQPWVYETIASVNGEQFDSDTSNNTATWAIVVASNTEQDIDLATSLSAPASSSAWDSFTYTLTYQNNSMTDTVYGVSVYLNIDESLENVQSNTPWYDSNENIYRWYIPSLAPGQQWQIVVTVDVEDETVAWYTATTLVSISSPFEDSIDENNDSTQQTTMTQWIDIQATADLIIEETTWCLDSENSATIVISDTNDLTDPSLILQFPTQLDVTALSTPSQSSAQSYTRELSSTEFSFVDLTIAAESIGSSMPLVVQLYDQDDLVYTSQVLITVSNCNQWGNNQWSGQSNTGNSGNDLWWSQWWVSSIQTTLSHPVAPSTNGDSQNKVHCIEEDALDLYAFAYENGITTMKSLQEARLCDKITRIELAIMVSKYMQNILDKKPDTSRNCKFNDDHLVNEKDRPYMETACQLHAMWLKFDGKPDQTFNPHGTVTRDQWSTVLSRILWQDTNNGNPDCRYCWHMADLKKEKIIKYDNPAIVELRAFVMLMMYRSTQ